MRKPKAVPVHNLKVTRRGVVKKRNILWRMRRVFYLGALAVTVLTAGLAYVLTQIDLPTDPLIDPVQPQTSFICAAEVRDDCNASNAMAQLHGNEDRDPIAWEQIPEVLRQAVVSAEDREFFKHRGVDPMGIARALYHDVRGTSVSRQGGSTITQQYVKTEYLSAEQTFTRKIREAVMAIKLEQQISKEQILTRYLNTVYFGRGAYGVQAASRVWFGHDVEEVDPGEAAFLAGLLRSPNGADPYRNDESLTEAIRRRRVVLQAMVDEGYLTAEEREIFEAVPLDPDAGAVRPEDRMVQPPPKPSTFGAKVKGSEYGSTYFVEHVRQWLSNQYPQETVLGGGLKVYTTLDLSMQQKAYTTVTGTLNQVGDPVAAIVSLDRDGEIKAMVGGTDWDNAKVNLATGQGGLGRQAGSTFKIFALADAMRQGYSVESVMPGPPQITIPDAECRDEDDEPWQPRGGNGAPQSLVSATKNSTNTVFAALAMELGVRSVAQTAIDMGVGSLEGEKPQCSWVLGSAEVNPLEMAAAYATIMNQGVYNAPIAVTRVEFPDGRVDTFTGEERRVLTPEQAGRLVYAMRSVIEGGTGRRADIGRPAAGKTGTTQQNADAWFVGFTPSLATAVWMGYATSNSPMKDVHGIEVSGSTFPAQMWAEYMSSVFGNAPPEEFPELDPETLSAGEPVLPAYGRTTIVAGGQADDTGGGGATTPTTAGVPVPSQPVSPPSTAPVTTTAPPPPETSSSAPPSTDEVPAGP